MDASKSMWIPFDSKDSKGDGKDAKSDGIIAVKTRESPSPSDVFSPARSFSFHARSPILLWLLRAAKPETHMVNVLNLCLNFLKGRVIAIRNDQMAFVFYNTVQTHPSPSPSPTPDMT